MQQGPEVGLGITDTLEFDAQHLKMIHSAAGIERNLSVIAVLRLWPSLVDVVLKGASPIRFFLLISNKFL